MLAYLQNIRNLFKCLLHDWTKWRQIERSNIASGKLEVWKERVCLKCGKQEEQLVDEIYLGV